MFKIIENKLQKEYIFNNFLEALDFVNEVGKISEKQNHHPDIFINSYKKVKIILFTHEDKKITDKDYYLSNEIEKLYIYKCNEKSFDNWSSSKKNISTKEEIPSFEKGKNSFCILSQLRLFSSKRLAEKKGMLGEDEFIKLKQKIKALI